MTVHDFAVSVQQAHFHYGFGRFKSQVLKGITLHVAPGSIYGLLGPSGCGKTTLLKCVVGRLEPVRGTVRVFGKTPGRGSSAVPGSDVGYMPQELALYHDLTIAEILSYFGRIHHMKRDDVRARIIFLLNLLNLPPAKRLIANLSGGQKRRVSFAIALLHEPPLLILDEPTVGVDPILRESIWDHLIEMCTSGRTTAIITTHYIEEARQANKVGLMRNGKILTEDTPVNLLERYSMQTLEDVYLKLCREDDKERDVENKSETNEQTRGLLQINNKAYQEPVITEHADKPRFTDYISLPSLSRINGSVIKNFIRMRRSTILLFFQFLNPAIQIVAFCMAIGANPRDIPVAVYNQDRGMGESYLRQISTEMITQVPVDSMNEGVDLVINGQAAAVVHIWNNFTFSLMKRFTTRGNISHDVIQAGSVHLRQDTTDQQITFFLQRELQMASLRFVENQLKDVSRYPQLLVTIFDIREPIYGSLEPYFTEFMASGLIPSIIFFVAVGLTALSFVIEKKEGLLDRSYVSGVTSFEVMSGHIITQLGIVIIQVTIVLGFAIYVFDIHNEGNIIWVILLALAQGICGMTKGFFISTICEEETSAIMIAVGTFFPFLLLSGGLWPRSAMGSFLYDVSPFLPLTLAVQSMRWIMLRGRDITWYPVWIGYIATICWNLIFLASSLVVMRIRR